VREACDVIDALPPGTDEGFDAVTVALADDITAAAFPAEPVSWCVPLDTWLDFHACLACPSDFGGVSFVDRITGQIAMAANVVHDGTGELVSPALGPAADLLPTVAPATPPVDSHWWDTGGPGCPGGYEDPSVGIVALDAVRQMEIVVDWLNGQPYDALVVLLPYSVGGYAPEVADIAVLLRRQQ
jgi:hypothetical protein